MNEYQRRSRETVQYPGAIEALTHDVPADRRWYVVAAAERIGLQYCVLGLVSEVGEIAARIKRAMRDRRGRFTTEDLDGIAGEIGDSLWYLAQIATEIDRSLQGIADENLAKLADRKARGKIQGKGDTR